MITQRDLDEAIAECYGKRNHTSGDCVKLAAYMTIKDRLYGAPEAVSDAGYSYAPSHDSSARATIDIEGGSEFAKAASGMAVEDFVGMMDELAEAVRVLNPRLYSELIYRIRAKNN